MIGEFTREITLDINKAGVQERIPVRQGDSLVHKFNIRLKADGVPCHPADVAWASVAAMLPSGDKISADCRAGANGSYSFTPGAGFFKEGGAVLCRLILRGEDGGELYSPAFALDAEHSFAADGEAVTAEEYSYMETMLRQMLDAKKSCETAAVMCPKIGEDGCWLVWDSAASEYRNTGIGAEGGTDGRGIASFEHTGTESSSVVNPDQVLDVYTMRYTDETSIELKIPRGARWFSGAYAGPGTNTTLLTVSGAILGDIFVSTVTGHVWQCGDENGRVWLYKLTMKGADGKDGATAEEVIAALPTETWTFTLEDGSVVEKAVPLI